MPDGPTKPARLDQNLVWIALLLLLIGCLLVLRPFVSALLWAALLMALIERCWAVIALKWHRIRR